MKTVIAAVIFVSLYCVDVRAFDLKQYQQQQEQEKQQALERIKKLNSIMTSPSTLDAVFINSAGHSLGGVTGFAAKEMVYFPNDKIPLGPPQFIIAKFTTGPDGAAVLKSPKGPFSEIRGSLPGYQDTRYPLSMEESNPKYIVMLKDGDKDILSSDRFCEVFNYGWQPINKLVPPNLQSSDVFQAKIHAVENWKNDQYRPVTTTQLNDLLAAYHELFQNIPGIKVPPFTPLGPPVRAVTISEAKRLLSTYMASDLYPIPGWWLLQYANSNDTPSTPAKVGCGLTLLDCYKSTLNPNEALKIAPTSQDALNGNPGNLSSSWFEVAVTDAAHKPVINIPVTFTAPINGGVQLGSCRPKVATVSTNTDDNGLTHVFVILPNTSNESSQVIAFIGTNAIAQPSNTITRLPCKSEAGRKFPSPYLANVTADVNIDGSVDMHWINRADPEDSNSIDITYADGAGNLVKAGTASPGSSYLHIPPENNFQSH